MTLEDINARIEEYKFTFNFHLHRIQDLLNNDAVFPIMFVVDRKENDASCWYPPDMSLKQIISSVRTWADRTEKQLKEDTRDDARRD